MSLKNINKNSHGREGRGAGGAIKIFFGANQASAEIS